MEPKVKKSQSKTVKNISIPDIDLITLLRNKVKEHEQENAVYFQGKFKTYSQLEAEVNKLSNALNQLGVKKGTRVAVYLPNCPQFITTFFAVQALGGIFIALNPLYSAREVEQRLNDCKPKVFLTLNLFADKVQQIQKDISIDHIIVTSVARELPLIKKYLYKIITLRKAIHLENSLSYDQLLQDGENKIIKKDIKPNEDVAVLQYTGGTTGSPKGAMLTHKNLIYQTTVLHYWKTKLEKQPEGQNHVAGVLPYSHIFGLTSSFLWSISEGATQYLIPDPRKLEDIMQLIHSHKIHFLYCVPVFFQKFATHKNLKAYNLSSLHLCISGGESLPKETVTVFEKNTGCLLIEGYGLSEASPVTHVNPPTKKERKIDSIGVTIPNTKAKIMHTETDQEITDFKTPGELWVKGPGVMKGYWKQPTATKDVFRNEWLRTGDIATYDTTGYYQIVDRLKDMIIVSGFKVWPNEVEEILLTHPSILEAAVIGFKSELGTKIKAILVKKPDADMLSLEDLRSFCKDNLASYKIPKLIEYRQSLPRSPVGKILRRELRSDAT
jgi:long-chain acyl-CoA synthetase